MQESFGRNTKALPSLVSSFISVHKDNNKDACINALISIIYLCRNDGVNRNTCSEHNVNKLGAHGACDQVVRVLKQYGCHYSELAYYGCWCILNLSSNDANNIKLGSAGANDIVIDVLKKYGCLSEDVALYGSRAVCNLAVNGGNQAKLRVDGASEIIIETLKKYGKVNADVALYGCRAIINLAANKTKLGGTGICECVVEILKNFGLINAHVAAEVCKLISYLSSHESNNKAKCGGAGACEIVIDVLKKFGNYHSDCALYGCHAIFNLETQKNRVRLLNHGAIDIVTSLTKASSISEEARNRAKEALFKITEEKSQKTFGKDAREKKKESNLGTIDGILEALQICQKDASKNDLAEKCFNAILSLIKNNKEQQESFGLHMHAIPAFINASRMIYFSNNEEINIYALNVLIYLCRYDGVNIDTSNELNISKLGEYGSCDQTVRILKSYGCLHLQVAEFGCRALSYLACNDINNSKVPYYILLL